MPKNITREDIEVMTDRELLAAALENQSPGFREHSGRTLMLRNGRWGTCSGCPQSGKDVYPERCGLTDRYDHNIHVTKDGKFYEYGREVPRSKIIEWALS